MEFYAQHRVYCAHLPHRYVAPLDYQLSRLMHLPDAHDVVTSNDDIPTLTHLLGGMSIRKREQERKEKPKNRSGFAWAITSELGTDPISAFRFEMAQMTPSIIFRGSPP